jgi:hypothetical protein
MELQNMNQQTQPQQQTMSWLTEEQNEIAKTQLKPFENTPALKLEENKVYEITIDFSKPFEKWTDPASGAIKKIIPITYQGQKMNFWLNTANPLYSAIIVRGNTGQTVFKIIRIGQAKATKYNLVS